MTPTLIPGQLIVATGLLKPKVGRIVIARKDDREIVKRVVATNSDEIKLAGDNTNAAHDVTVPAWRVYATKLL